MLDLGELVMLDLSSPTSEFVPNAAPWYATGAHPVPPPSGTYILVDHAVLLSAASPGLIAPVLVLLRAEDVELMRQRHDDPIA
jgi:hypothetical protein